MHIDPRVAVKRSTVIPVPRRVISAGGHRQSPSLSCAAHASQRGLRGRRGARARRGSAAAPSTWSSACAPATSPSSTTVNIDRIAAEELIATGASGRAQRLAIHRRPLPERRAADAGPRRHRPLDVPDAGPFELLDDGDRLTVDGGTVSVAGQDVLRGRVLGAEELDAPASTSSASGSTRRSPNSPRTRSPTSARRPTCSPAGSSSRRPGPRFRDRHVLIVVRGERHRRDLKALRAYIRDVRPLIVAVDGGADGVLEAGLKPDLILGDMDSASDEALALRRRADRPRLPRRPRPRPRAAARGRARRTRSSPPPAPARTWRC